MVDHHAQLGSAEVLIMDLAEEGARELKTPRSRETICVVNDD